MLYAVVVQDIYISLRIYVCFCFLATSFFRKSERNGNIKMEENFVNKLFWFECFSGRNFTRFLNICSGEQFYFILLLLPPFEIDMWRMYWKSHSSDVLLSREIYFISTRKIFSMTSNATCFLSIINTRLFVLICQTIWIYF